MLLPGDPLPAPPDRAPDLDDAFTGDTVDSSTWVSHYLPQWTTPERSAARVRPLRPGLELRIEADQPDWRPEDAPLRVSNLQTGVFSGPVGSRRGTHRHRPDGLVVRTETPVRLLFAPTAGRVDVTITASRDPGCMTAVWLVGTGHRGDEEAGEICVCEIDADAVGATTRSRIGIKAHADPRLVTDMADVSVPVDAGQPHTWTAIWEQDRTVIGCEGVVVRALAQAPAYPLFLMIDLFEIGPPSGGYPKTVAVHRVRGWDLSPRAAR